MTDEQANNITREQAIRILHPDTSIEAIDDYEEAGNYEHAYDTACLIAVSAILGSQPDPDTGLVPCGCGGKAKITEQSLNWLIKCVECGIQLEVYGGRGGAVWSWNRAMGWEDKG